MTDREFLEAAKVCGQALRQAADSLTEVVTHLHEQARIVEQMVVLAEKPSNVVDFKQR